MGIVEKSIRKRSNQNLAAPVYTNSLSSPQELVTQIVELCNAHNREVVADLQRRRNEGSWIKRKNAEGTRASDHCYHASLRNGPEILIGFSRTPAEILGNTRKQQGFTAGHWLAMVRFPPPTPETPPGQTVVEVHLMKWLMDGNGRLQNRDKYETFVDAIHAAVSVDA